MYTAEGNNGAAAGGMRQPTNYMRERRSPHSDLMSHLEARTLIAELGRGGNVQ